MKASVVDLFCGVGGMTHGLQQEGLNVVAGLDIDGSCQYAYEKNNSARFILKDITKVSGAEIAELYPAGDLKVLVGCAPCQPFSAYNKFKKKDAKWRLLGEFSRLINDVEPDIVSMENVPQLKNHLNSEVFGSFVDNLEEKGYWVSAAVVKSHYYGVPQVRRRLVLLASKLGQIELIPPTHKDSPVTVRAAIGKLAPIAAGEVHSADPLHRARGLTPLNKTRLQHTPEGGGWKDWPRKLWLRCHRTSEGRSFRSVYGRMRWDQPAPTMTTQCIGIGNGRFGHPVQDRAISLREAAILQTFPNDYDFINPAVPFSGHAIAMHIGNAVPVRLGSAIGKSINRHVDELCLKTRSTSFRSA